MRLKGDGGYGAGVRCGGTVRGWWEVVAVRWYPVCRTPHHSVPPSRTLIFGHRMLPQIIALETR